MRCSVSEMYDLCTVKDKIGVIGIHTPTMGLIARSWKGLLDNFKYIRLISCNVKIACASHQALDPLQIGSGSDEVAPQDMMNPILYRACTNDSWNAIMNRLYASGATDRNSLRYFQDAFASIDATQQDNIYYALLASNEWRKAMPQAGLDMANLKPFVYQVVNTYGNIGNGSNTTGVSNLDDGVTVSGAGNNVAAVSGNKPITFRGHAMPYPPVPCSRPGSTTSNESDYPLLNVGHIPKSYVACILMPPSKSRIMYYRLLITWNFEFMKPVPLYDKYVLTDVASVGANNYGRSYSFTEPDEPHSKEDDLKQGNTLDTIDAPLELVLQK